MEDVLLISSGSGIYNNDCAAAPNSWSYIVFGSNDAFENACMEFDEENLKPTYKILWGVPGIQS